MATERGQLRLGQSEAVVAGAAGVGHHPTVRIGAGEREAAVAGRQHLAGTAHALARAVLDADRHAPGLCGVAARAQRQEALLVQVQHHAARLGLQLRLQIGHAGLVEEAAERGLDILALAGRGGDGIDQIVGSGVAEAVRADVVAHAAAEGILADELFEHAQHRGALAVGDAVEGGLDVAVAGDRLADLARADQAVVVHRVMRGTDAVQVGAVLRPQAHGDLLLHPGGEGLVEPQVIPPGHGHRVAGPLVRQLVRGDVERALDVVPRRMVVQQQQPVAEGDEPGVLHRAGGEVRRGHQIQLVERIAEVVVVLQRGDDLRRLLQRAPDARALSLCSDAAQGCGLRALRRGRQCRPVDHVPRPDRVSHQVGRQRHGLGEAHGLPALARRFGGLGAGIGQRLLALGHGQAQRERRLQRRLVEAGEGVARTDRLHLRQGVGMPLRLDLVEPLQLLIERRAVDDGQGQLLRLQGAPEGDAGHAGLRVGLGVAHRERCTIGGAQRGLAHSQLLAVQPQMVGGALQAHAQGGSAVEVGALRIDLQVQRIVLRHRPIRQASGRHRIGGLRAGRAAAQREDGEQHATGQSWHGRAFADEEGDDLSMRGRGCHVMAASVTTQALARRE
ncbi:hypothetical protein NB689_002941 [Xanthomonas sacchari]|nr:hypothetical protein [Xanthomonas sacchari]